MREMFLTVRRWKTFQICHTEAGKTVSLVWCLMCYIRPCHFRWKTMAIVLLGGASGKPTDGRRTTEPKTESVSHSQWKTWFCKIVSVSDQTSPVQKTSLGVLHIPWTPVKTNHMWEALSCLLGDLEMNVKVYASVYWQLWEELQPPSPLKEKSSS